MKIYWRDRQGNKAPPNAIFSCYPFSSDHCIDFHGPYQIVQELPKPCYDLKIKNHQNLPSRESWIQNIDKALSLKLEKVVLARRKSLELVEIPDPFAIASALQEKSKGSFIFCIQKGNKAFIGASPERLFSRNQNEILTEAMAGTRPRGKTEKEDKLLQNELLSSEKDLREINPVQTFLRDRLSPFCITSPLFSPLSIHQTNTVQHLYSQAKAKLKTSISDYDILQAIHPTPALCGTPQIEAFRIIRELEPFERGLYGGVIGWRTEEASEWLVAIRSCFIEDRTVHLFSGAGIVHGSKGEEEWNELDHKLKLFKDIFSDTSSGLIC